MIGWHHRLNGHEFEQALGAGDRQGSLVCCSPWVVKSRLDTTKRLNNNKESNSLSSLLLSFFSPSFRLSVFSRLMVFSHLSLNISISRKQLARTGFLKYQLKIYFHTGNCFRT